MSPVKGWERASHRYDDSPTFSSMKRSSIDYKYNKDLIPFTIDSNNRSPREGLSKNRINHSSLPLLEPIRKRKKLKSKSRLSLHEKSSQRSASLNKSISSIINQ